MKNILHIITIICLISCTRNTHQNIIPKNHCFDILKINNSKKPKIFFSLDPECPLCKSYSKTMNTLKEKYNDEVDFYGFFPSKVFSKKKINEFIEKYHFDMKIIADTNQILTNFLDAKVTPECFLIDSNQNIIYYGLIDDWIKEIGRKRTHIENKYLEENLINYLSKREIKIKKTKAIGCIIQK